MNENCQCFIIIIIIKNECHSNIIVDRLQGCSHSKKLREGDSESRSSKVVWQALSVVTVQISGGDEKCPVTKMTALPLANCSFMSDHRKHVSYRRSSTWDSSRLQTAADNWQECRCQQSETAVQQSIRYCGKFETQVLCHFTHCGASSQCRSVCSRCDRERSISAFCW